MKKIHFLFVLAHFAVVPAISQVSEKDAVKLFAPKGNHRSPFKSQTEACFTSVNLQFKLASRETLEKRGVGNVVSWAFLEGVDENLMQEIADEYYKRLDQAFKENGINVTDDYKQTDAYNKLVEKNADRSREVFKKNWGVSRIVTANQAPYIEYPVGLMGPHASLGNDLKKPVGQIFVTIDFAEFVLNITKSNADWQGIVKTTSKSNLIPVIRIEGVTREGKMRGDGSYALFTGRNWGYTNAIMTNNKTIASEKAYALSTEGSKGFPVVMKRFKSDLLGDMASIFTGTTSTSGRGTGEFTYTVKADPVKYKQAVLDALDQFNQYLIAYINSTR